MSGWRVLLLAATMSLGAAPAFAGHQFPPPPPPPPSTHGHGVPEIDPRLGGCGDVARGRCIPSWRAHEAAPQG